MKGTRRMAAWLTAPWAPARLRSGAFSKHQEQSLTTGTAWLRWDSPDSKSGGSLETMAELTAGVLLGVRGLRIHPRYCLVPMNCAEESVALGRSERVVSHGSATEL